MKRIILFLTVFILCFGITVSAEEAVTVSSECDISDVDVPITTETVNAAIGQTLDIKAKSAVLMEPSTGKVLYEQNSDEKLPPASITKIMSLLLVMEAIDRGDISLETVVTADEHACSMGGSQIWLEPGESMTVDELLKATVIASANDACVALGEFLAGSEEGFVAQMNEKAKQLGMNNTNFVNCTGLDADGHLTTAYDVALMSSELIKHDLIKNYSTVWMDSLRDGKSELVNTNKLVRFYKGATGLKTGTTSKAGCCLSATAERDGMELVAVVMSGNSSTDRFEGAKKLLDYGFSNFGLTEISGKISDKLSVKVKKGTRKKVFVKEKEALSVILPKNEQKNIECKTELNNNLTAPIKAGDEVGKISVYNKDELLGEIKIVSKDSCERLSFGYSLVRILKGLFQ